MKKTCSTIRIKDASFRTEVIIHLHTTMFRHNFMHITMVAEI